MNLIDISAYSYLLVTTLAVIFQLGLAVGMPWGAYAMKGRFPGRFPMRMRPVAFFQALLLAVFAIVILNCAGLLFFDWLIESWMGWIVVPFSLVAFIMNTITPSLKERRLWSPVTFVMLTSSFIVMCGKF